MDNDNRRVFTTSEAVIAAGNPKVLGIPVKVPDVIVTGPWDETEEGIPAIEHIEIVFVEIDVEERERLKAGGQGAINDFAKTVGHLASAALGGYVKGWKD